MPLTMTEALKLIAERCPSIAHEAVKTIGFAGRTVQMRYNWLAEQALRSGEHFSEEERRDLIALFEPLNEETRDSRLELRLTESERVTLDRLAEEAGQTVSEYVRHRLFGVDG